MISLWICLCVCITVLVITAMLIKWGIPTITFINKYEYPQDEKQATEKPMGFKPPAQEERREPEELSDKEKREQLLQDAVSTASLLLQGEVDIDDIISE